MPPGLVGATLSRYRIEEELGRGGMGVVYRAVDTQLGRSVALKVLTKPDDPERRERFLREARSGASLTHTNLGRIYDVGRASTEDGAEEIDFIAMELIEGETLKARLERGTLSTDEAVGVAMDVARGLAAIHASGMIHRDIKPSNLMLLPDGSAKVLDFGLMRIVDGVDHTRTGVMVGTVAYFSPEQARGEAPDHRSDLFSLGVVIYEMLTGKRAFASAYDQAVVYHILHEEPPSLHDLRPDLPHAVVEVVERLLRKSADDRHQSAEAVIRGLEAAVGGRSVAAAPEAPVANPRDTRAGVTKVVALIVVVALTAVAYGLATREGQTPEPDLPSYRPIVLEAMDQAQNLRLSGDHRYLAFSGADTSGRAGLFVYDAATGDRHGVHDGVVSDPADFSPSGTRIAYAPAQQGVWVADALGGNRRQVDPSGRHPVWLDETTLLYMRDQWVGPSTPGQHGLWKTELDTGESARLIAVPDSSMFRYVPGGKLGDTGLAYGHVERVRYLISDSTHLFFLDPMSKVLTLGESGIAHPRIVGNRIVFETEVDASVRTALLDLRRGRLMGSSEEVARPALGSLGGAAWSVSAQGALLLGPTRIRERRPTRLFEVFPGDSVRTVPVQAEFGLRDVPFDLPAVSQDGRRLAFQVSSAMGEAPKVLVLDLRLGLITMVGDNHVHPRWTPEGGVMMTARASGTSVVWGDGGLIATAHPPLAAPSPDGRFVAYQATAEPAESGDAFPRMSRVVLAIRDLASGREMNFQRVDSRLQRFWQFSPDSRFVAWTVFEREQTRIWVASTDGSFLQPLPLASVNFPHWGADGYLYYYHASESGEQIMRLPVATEPGFRVLGVPEDVAWGEGGLRLATDPSGSRLFVSGRRLELGPPPSKDGEQALLVEDWIQSRGS
ncbi:MAG: serine/threonine-protein kinase [Rhodothermales bacterium]|nr:serine/threonine-protein kinase [Rhodothermales bacterium]MBO6779009.1 serine/threonine-protein kinase [Rhodothermales bacterium]